MRIRKRLDDLWNEESRQRLRIDVVEILSRRARSLNLLRTAPVDWSRIAQLRMRICKTPISRRDLNQSMRRW